MRLRRPPARVDALLALALSVLTVATLLPDLGRIRDVVALCVALLAVVPVAFRQRAPLVVLLSVAAALAAYELAGFGEWPSGGVGLVIAIFTVAALRPPAAALAVMPVVAAVVLLPRATDRDATWPLLLQALLVCGCAWAVGDGTRRWARAAEEAAARAERLVAAERIRIARELHDVVAHHMSVVALQTGVAEYVLVTDPPTAREAMATAGSASREALAEMGRLLDALRTDQPDDEDLAPQPGLARLDELVERVRRVGVDVHLRKDGTSVALGTGRQLCVFRVVQESLTNVLKHAGPGARATITLRYDGQRLVTEVVDDGGVVTGRRPAAPNAGRGIDGMRERAELYGGTLTAGPLPHGGFRVRLDLPIGQDAA